MKKVGLVLLMMCTVFLLGCGGQSAERIQPIETEATLQGKIVALDGTQALLVNRAEDSGVGDVYWINTEGLALFDRQGSALESNDLKAGSMVDIGYSGLIMETFPAQLADAQTLTVIEQKDDLVGLYRNIIQEIYQVDEGLNEAIEMAAFDLTGVSQLTETEKSALVYLMGNQWQIETQQSTYDQLCADGYIDEENVYFDKGILITLTDSEIKEGQMTFSISKWRSGLGAIGTSDGVAQKENDQWQYVFGQMWIS